MNINLILHIKLNLKISEAELTRALILGAEGLVHPSITPSRLMKQGKLKPRFTYKELETGGISCQMSFKDTDIRDIIDIGLGLSLLEQIGPASCEIEWETSDPEEERKRKWESLRNETYQELGYTPVNRQKKTVRAIYDSESGHHYGKEFSQSEEIYVLEGKRDILNLARYGIHNTFSMDGKFDNEIRDKLAGKRTILFFDGDLSARTLINTYLQYHTPDYFILSPYQREVEHLTEEEVRKVAYKKIPFSKFIGFWKFYFTDANKFSFFNRVMGSDTLYERFHNFLLNLDPNARTTQPFEPTESDREILSAGPDSGSYVVTTGGEYYALRDIPSGQSISAIYIDTPITPETEALIYNLNPATVYYTHKDYRNFYIFGIRWVLVR